MLARLRAFRTREPVRSETPPVFHWAAAILLGLTGLLVNLVPVALSPGTDLVFGGIAYLLAAATLGPLHGTVAAAIASARTLWLWNHPFAWLIFSLEALVVGWLVQRWDRRPLGADLLYWLAVGVPFLLVTYYGVLEVRGTTFVVIALKQSLNGMINAVLVEMLLLLPAVRRLLRIPGTPRLQSAIAVVVATAAIVPALIFGIWVGRREWDRNVERARDRASLFADAYASKLQQYVLLHERAARSVAEASERRGTFDPEQLQRLVSGENEQFPGFVDMYAADSRGITVAFSPVTRREGRSLIGLDFSDRDYYQEMRRTRRPLISNVFAGRGGVNEPLVVVAQPIVLADTFAGFVLGALDLKALPPPTPTPIRQERLRVVDAQGVLVFDSRHPYRAGERPRTLTDSLSFRAVREIRDRAVIRYNPEQQHAAPSRAVGQVLAGVARIPALNWWVWIEQPFSEVQDFVAQSYVRLFGLLISVMLLALLLSTALAHALARPLLRLRAAAGALAAGDLHARVGRFSPAVPQEVHELGRGFDEMAEVLVGRTEELEELGEIARSLTSTLELHELLHRITDAAVRLVDPDGCSIALLDTESETLRTAEYSVGLLEESAGSQIQAERSMVGRVALSGAPLRIDDVATDPRVDASFLDPARIRSVICAPLTGRAGPLGVLVAVRGRSNPASFAAADLLLLERLAGNASIAVENARLLEAAQAASRAKSDFIATMSHELRTPLNAVLGHLELLEMGIHGKLSEAQSEALARIRTATRHLRGLIEEILSFSRLEAGRTEVHLAETDLCVLVREVGTVVEPLAREKGLRFDVQCDLPDLLAVTDADKIRQILINLAGNAVKFTDQGEVTVMVGARGADAVITVHDTGVGIAPEDQDRLFRPFEQLETGLSRPHGGTGLGLYLSGRYAMLVGGRIEVDSEPGRGSRFSLILPREGPREAAA